MQYVRLFKIAFSFVYRPTSPNTLHTTLSALTLTDRKLSPHERYYRIACQHPTPQHKKGSSAEAGAVGLKDA